MPFQNVGNRAFTETSIRKNAPAAPGVFGLSNAREWIYVGQSVNIQAELLELLDDPPPFFHEHVPAGFTFERSAAAKLIERQNQLVMELEPVGNRRPGY